MPNVEKLNCCNYNNCTWLNLNNNYINNIKNIIRIHK